MLSHLFSGFGSDGYLFFFFLSIQIIFIFKKWAEGCLTVNPWLEPTEATTSCWGSDIYPAIVLSVKHPIDLQVVPRATHKGDWEM